MPRGGKREGAGQPRKLETSDGRTRNWNFILYPESAPENWRDVINETRIEWIESPLHDKDINPQFTGKESEIDSCKKAHYHITLLFPSQKSYEQVKSLTDSLKSPIPIPCQSVKGSIRYMVHKDNPEKFQYDWNDIKPHGGADLDSLCMATHTERLQIQKDITLWIRYNDVDEFEDIVNYALDEGLNDWYNVMMNFSTHSLTAYIKSRRHRKVVRDEKY
jgi:hypothetical protein